MVYLARHEGRAPLRLSAAVGDRFPCSVTAVGRILLAQLSDDEIRALYPQDEDLAIWTEKSVSTVEGLLERLDTCRRQGYAIDDRETNAVVYGMAKLVPARRDGDDPFAVGVSLMAAHATEEHRACVRTALAELRDHLAAPRLLRP